MTSSYQEHITNLTTRQTSEQANEMKKCESVREHLCVRFFPRVNIKVYIEWIVSIAEAKIIQNIKCTWRENDDWHALIWTMADSFHSCRYSECTTNYNIQCETGEGVKIGEKCRSCSSTRTDRVHQFTHSTIIFKWNAKLMLWKREHIPNKSLYLNSLLRLDLIAHGCNGCIYVFWYRFINLVSWKCIAYNAGVWVAAWWCSPHLHHCAICFRDLLNSHSMSSRHNPFMPTYYYSYS